MKAFKGLTAKLGILGELLDFLWQRKLWWLIPIIFILVLFGIFMAVASSTGLAPFIYTMF